MALTDIDRTDTARQLATLLFVTAEQTANLNAADIKAAVVQLDTDLDTTLSTAVTAFGGATTIVNALIASLPEPFKSTSTAAQKALALSYVCMKRAGLI